ncbi:MAG: class I SAM-dependent methyltransferase [Bacteroidetes bacterium]|nr:class I SAM-dependent methyltransferase [Bacteroidota bacterium]
MDHSIHAAEIFNKYANEYQYKFMDVSLYHETLDTFCNQLHSPNAAILELACGPGNITKYLLDKRPDLKITATDLAPNMIELAKLNNPSANFKIMDCRAIDKIDIQYDGILAGFCLPYLSREEAVKLIHDAALRIKPSGVLYISTMEDDNNKSGIRKGSQGDEIYMNFHEAGYLTAALLENNFRLIDTKRIESPASDGSTIVDLILIAEKY